MSRTVKTVIGIIGIIVGTLILSVLAYYIGSFLGKSLLTAGGTSYTVWQDHFFKLVRNIGIISGIISLVWYLLARFVLKVEYAYNVGKRVIWCIIGFIELFICFVVPYVTAFFDNQLKINIAIPLLFVFLYTILGYWLGSILSTPAPFKYTPLGAVVIRGARGRK